jgi:hypothetical protein
MRRHVYLYRTAHNRCCPQRRAHEFRSVKFTLRWLKTLISLLA